MSIDTNDREEAARMIAAACGPINIRRAEDRALIAAIVRWLELGDLRGDELLADLVTEWLDFSSEEQDWGEEV